MERSLKSIAKDAKQRMKQGFWQNYREERDRHLEFVKEQGLNESRAERYLTGKVASRVKGEKEDEFYERVKGLGGGKKAASRKGSQSWEHFLREHPDREIK